MKTRAARHLCDVTLTDTLDKQATYGIGKLVKVRRGDRVVAEVEVLGAAIRGKNIEAYCKIITRTPEYEELMGRGKPEEKGE